MPPQPRGLLLSFDAFNTLFRPFPSVAVQYALAANEFPGLSKVQPDQVKSAFSAAYRAESRRNPNYGRATGCMGPEKWWTNVINNTFQPLLDPGTSTVPPELAPRLLRRFSSNEGYELTSDYVCLFEPLRRHFAQKKTTLAVGIISNSDDRVLSTLTAFGIRHQGFYHGGRCPEKMASDDINFHCLSYDVGYEKPSREIFDAAEDMARVVAASKCAEEAGGDPLSASSPVWTKVHVGDIIEEDVEGAKRAGWHAILVESSEAVAPFEIPSLASYRRKTSKLSDVFPPSSRTSSSKPGAGNAVRAENVKEVLEWLSTVDIE